MSATATPTNQFSVAIVGGGIGGLALAVGLLRRNVRVQIYEAADAFRESELGLSIGPAAHRALPLIDPKIREIYDGLVTTHADSPGFEHFRQTWFELVWATGDQEGEVLMNLEASPSGQTSLRRIDFLSAMVSLIPKDVAQFGKRLTSLEENNDGVSLAFEDGTTTLADVVVGCDGIKSSVKPFILSPEEVERTRATYSGQYAHRAVLDMDTVVQEVGEYRAKVATLYIGKGAYAITYPVSRAQKVNCGLYKMNNSWDEESWVRPGSRDDMQSDFGHMGKHVNALMKHFPDPTKWGIFEHPHISTFYKSRVAILGDAAHASTPHQGAGAGQAIEDAHVLAELLSDPSVTTTEHAIAAFHAYDSIRRPRTQKVVSTSKENGDLLCLCQEGVGDDPQKLKDTWKEMFRWLWDLDVEEQVESARTVMLETIGKSGVTG